MKRGRFFGSGALAGLLLGLCGCAHYHVLASAPERGTQPESRVSNSIGWGATRDDVAVDNCPTGALAEVRFRRNFGQSLAAIVTLGLWQPATITWYCRKPEAPPGEIGGASEGG